MFTISSHADITASCALLPSFADTSGNYLYKSGVGHTITAGGGPYPGYSLFTADRNIPFETNEITQVRDVIPQAGVRLHRIAMYYGQR